MKKRGILATSSSGGILRWSTFCILAGGVVGLSSCERGHVATAEDVEMAATQERIEKLDSEKARLTQGLVSNNFYISRVGYYHAATSSFFEHPYNFEQDGRYFVNGQWQNQPGEKEVPPSRPSADALAKVDAALAEEQKLASSGQRSGSGFSAGNALMMYWLLSGNRGMFSPGAGFRQANGQTGNWQRDVEDKRGQVSRHAAGSPGYQRLVQESRATGQSVKPGQAVRGGFGSSRSGGGSSFGG